MASICAALRLGGRSAKVGTRNPERGTVGSAADRHAPAAPALLGFGGAPRPADRASPSRCGSVLASWGCIQAAERRLAPARAVAPGPWPCPCCGRRLSTKAVDKLVE